MVRQDPASLIPSLILGFGLVACTENGPTTPEPGTFDKKLLLSGLATKVIGPGYANFATEAEHLRAETTAWASATPGSTTATQARSRAQLAFRTTMRRWQQMEPIQVGPAGSPTVMSGGLSLRDEIYSWPTFNHCRIDQVTVSADYAVAGFFDRELVNVYGLDALEYLLFVETAENVCAQPVAINRDGTWTQLGEEEVWRRRAAYAQTLAAEIKRQADVLAAAWGPSGSFVTGFVEPGVGASPYRTAQQTLDELFAALFYVDIVVKDEKLAKPAGLDLSCGTNACPELVELPLSDTSRLNIEANLEGLRAVLSGSFEADPTAIGFDDYLIAVKAEPVAVDLLQRVDDALVAVRAMDMTMEDAIERDMGAVRNVHALVKRVTDLLKSQFVSVLNIKLPDEGDGDND